MDRAITQQRAAASEDDKLKQSLGFWSLTAAGIGSVIGSGWLLAAMVAAQAAGPAALVSWVIGGALMLMIALVFAELGMVRPESGGLVRYPLYSNGRMTASIVGWAMWLAYVANPPTEASATVQYSSAYLHGVYNGTKLTALGMVIAIALMAVFVVINYLGVALFARSNNIITAIKVFLPTLTVILLIASGFHSQHFTQHGGFAPYGWSAPLGAIATAGLVFAYTGFRNVIELSGEARNPRRDLPWAMAGTVLFGIVLYLGLQVAFIGAVPGHQLVHGWHGVDMSSPFAQIAKVLGLMWLYWLLLADATLSPSGAAVVYTAANARNVYGLGKNGFFPQWLMRVDDRRGVPVRALLANFVIGIAFLLPLPSWQSLVSVLSAMVALTFSIGSVSLMVFRRVGLGDKGSRLPGMQVIAPLAFMVSSLVMLWESWDKLWKTIPLVTIGAVWYLVTWLRGHERGRADAHAGAWLVVYLVFAYAMSYIGSFGGRGWIPAPWDSVVVAVGSLATYVWGVRAGTTYLEGEDDLRAEIEKGLSDPAAAS